MPSVIAPEGRYLVALSRHVEAGEVVEVDDDTACSLIEQGWETPDGATKARSRSTKAGDAPATTED